MRSVDNSFYQSVEWKSLRRVYAKEHPFCEICLSKGLINPTRVVHHKIFLNKDNICNPSIALNKDNLQSLCQDCHNKIHPSSNKRYKVLENGEIETI